MKRLPVNPKEMAEIPKKEIDHVINALRRGSLTCAARNECLRRASKQVAEGKTKAGKPRYKLHWQCARCKEWWRESTALEVDHIVEIGSFTGDWNEFIRRMFFCGQENLQALCNVCHQVKTSGFNATARYERKKLPKTKRSK